MQDDDSSPEEGKLPETPQSPPTRTIKPLPRGSQRRVSFKSDHKQRYQLTVEIETRRQFLLISTYLSTEYLHVLRTWGPTVSQRG